MLKLMRKSSSKIVNAENSIFVFADSDFSKNASNVFKEHAIKKGKKARTFTFEKFHQINLKEKVTIIFVLDNLSENDVEIFIKFLDSQPSGYLANVKFAIITFSTDLSISKLLRSKLVEMGADEFYNKQGIITGEKSMIRSLSDELWTETETSPENRLRSLSWEKSKMKGKARSNEWLDYPVFVERFREGVASSDYIWSDNSMRNCFSGVDAVDWICENAKDGERISRAQAVGLGQKMLQDGYFSHITNEQPFRDKPLFYKFNDIENLKKNVWTPPSDWV